MDQDPKMRSMFPLPQLAQLVTPIRKRHSRMESSPPGTDEMSAKRLQHLANYIKGMPSSRDREDAQSIASGLLKSQAHGQGGESEATNTYRALENMQSLDAMLSAANLNPTENNSEAYADLVHDAQLALPENQRGPEQRRGSALENLA